MAQLVKNLPLCRRPEFDPWVGKISWRREWQPTLVLLPGESHGQRSLVDYGPRGHKELDMTEPLSTASMHIDSLIHSTNSYISTAILEDIQEKNH